MNVLRQVNPSRVILAVAVERIRFIAFIGSEYHANLVTSHGKLSTMSVNNTLYYVLDVYNWYDFQQVVRYVEQLSTASTPT